MANEFLQTIKSQQGVISHLQADFGLMLLLLI